MKILITTDWYKPVVNGVVTSVLTLQAELEKMGHEVRIATLAERGKAGKVGNVYYFRSLDAGKIYPQARVICPGNRKNMRSILQWGPDAVHSQCEFSSFLIAVRIAGKLSVPLIHTYHTVYEDYTHYFSAGKPWGRRAALLFSRFVLKRTDRVIVPTLKVKALLEGYGVDRPIEVIPTGINLEKYQNGLSDEEEISALRRQWGIKPGSNVLLALGRLAKEKNVEELIHYFNSLLNQKWELVITGDGPYRKELERIANHSEYGERIHFTGMIPPEETAGVYRAADMFLCASQSETQGITYLEALSSGIPVICRKDPCVEGIVRNGVNGWQYEDLNGFTVAVTALAENKELRERMGEEAKRTANAHSAQLFARKITSVYRVAIGEKETIVGREYAGIEMQSGIASIKNRYIP